VPQAPRYIRRTDPTTGIAFVFKTDPAAPDMLHIYAEHLTTAEDAMTTFREGESPVWDATHRGHGRVLLPRRGRRRLMTELRMTGSREPVEPFAVRPDQEAEIERQIAQADRGTDELRVTIRWGRDQLTTVRRAAARYGLPYQTYIKEAAFRQALADLEKVAAVDVYTPTAP